MITQKYLKECLHYNPDTGILTWLERPAHHFKTKLSQKRINSRFAGTQAGCTAETHKDYIKHFIRIDSKLYTTSRVIWLYMTGNWPENNVDHIDGDPTNNRWENLRDVPQAVNLKNKAVYKNNKSGITGILIKPNGKYLAYYSKDNRQYQRTFSDLDIAIDWRTSNLTDVGGYSDRHGRTI
ncbi:HNH endonuclease [Marinobacter sp. W-8]|uniref:HNH endonuclease n=1 Tax=Marinobacter sp. W-8 TaxID=3369658 RepID=UPI0037C50B1F